jgi:hypothetical protein
LARRFIYSPTRIEGDTVGLCILLSLLGNGSVNTFPRQRKIVRGVNFCVVRVILNESNRLVIPRITRYTTFVVFISEHLVREITAGTGICVCSVRVCVCV